MFPNPPITKIQFNLNGFTGYFKVNNREFAMNCSLKTGSVNLFLSLINYFFYKGIVWKIHIFEYRISQIL